MAVRDARAAMEAEKADETQAAVLQAISALDKAAEKGVIHKNNAARRKGRLMKRMAALNIEFKPAKVEEPKASEQETAEEPALKKSAAKKAASKKTTRKAATEKAAKKTTTKKAAAKTTKKSSKKSE